MFKNWSSIEGTPSLTAEEILKSPQPKKVVGLSFSALVAVLLLAACARTEIVESPKTGFVAETTEVKEPAVIWTSRTLSQSFDYLGQVKSRAWSYDGALERLIDAGKQLRADAIVDVHYEKVGFLSTMQAFAIKYR